MNGITYDVIPKGDVPANLVWVTPARNAGQIVEVSYANGVPRSSGEAVYDADEGDLWQRVTDRSDNSVAYYRRQS
jgi:hypothetical protein